MWRPLQRGSVTGGQQASSKSSGVGKLVSPHDLSTEYRKAFARGLSEHFGETHGGLLAAVIEYHPNLKIDAKKLKQTIDTDAGFLLESLVGNKRPELVMNAVREALIGSALVEDVESVKRWAKEAQVRHATAGDAWANSGPAWEWVLEHPQTFVAQAVAVKRFLGLI